jgi:DNA-binding MarR family transcriptional regulator
MTTPQLNETQQKIIDFLQTAQSWVSPSKIGMEAFGLKSNNASSKVSRHCKQLVEMGLVERSKKGTPGVKAGHYRIKETVKS